MSDNSGKARPLVSVSQSIICKLVLIGLILGATSASDLNAGDGTTEDVATVNGVSIPRKVFDVHLIEAQKRLAQNGKPTDGQQVTVMKKTIVNRLIEEELLVQESRKQNIVVAAKEVKASVRSIKSQYSDEAAYEQVLSGMNLTETELKAKIERQLCARKLIDAVVNREVTVSEKECREFYHAHPDYFVTPKRIKASHILVKLDDDAPDSQREEALKKIETIQQKLTSGDDFSELARKHSEDPSKDRGGDLGFFSRGQMVKPFEDAAFSLEKGATSGIVKTRFGLHLIKVTDIAPKSTLEYADVQKKIADYLIKKKSKQKIIDYIESLKNSAEIEILI